MLTLPVEAWIGNAAAVVSGVWGAVTQRSQGYRAAPPSTHTLNAWKELGDVRANIEAVVPPTPGLKVHFNDYQNVLYSRLVTDAVLESKEHAKTQLTLEFQTAVLLK